MHHALSIFDLDHTLLKANSSFCFGSYLYKKQTFSKLQLFACLSYYFRHKLFNYPLERLHTKVFNLTLKGEQELSIFQEAQSFLDQSLPSLFYQPALDRLMEAQAQGHFTAILSSSPDFIVKQIANQLGVSVWLATSYQTNEKGEFTHIKFLVNGEKKALYVKELISQFNLEGCPMTVYSDSHLDLPMLNLANKPIGVKPNGKLKKICLRNRWEII